MAHFSALLGRRVEVQYRAGDIFLPATGTLVADSGRSIFLEEHIERHGQMKHFRWEIPYQCIMRVEEKPTPAAPEAPATPAAEAPGQASNDGDEEPARNGTLFHLRDRPKEA